MSVFETGLKKGRFVVGQCSKCQKIAWPPNDFCSGCFGSLLWRDLKQPGTLLEHSQKDGRKFCIVEFERAVKIMGVLIEDVEPTIGQNIQLANCGFDKSPRFEFSVVPEVN